MAELRIPIIGEFKGQKAFNQAGKATSTLEKGVKRLGGALAATFGAQQLLKFAKNAAKAFIEDEQAAVRLAQSVKNLGLAFETPRIEEFISQLSKASGVTDDQLRPAMQKLLQTTGSVAKSTELLTQALDISRGSGVDYETVVNDLSMAYVGQTRGLKKYGLGLTNAELKTMSFADVQKKLTDQFSGANAAYLETYAGKMQILSTAAGEAQETIGKGLVDSLALLAGDGNSIQPLADSMQAFATYVADAIYGVAVLVDKLKGIPGGEFLANNQDTILRSLPVIGPVTAFLDQLNKLGAGAKPGMGGYPSSALGGTYVDPNDAARKAAEAAAAKHAKQLAAMQAKSLALQKKNLSLQKASKTLNLDAIGIEAALKGKISETDRISLELQKAILDGNAVMAEKLAKDLEAAVKRNNELRLALLTTPEAPNPYRNWKAPEFGKLLPEGFTPPKYPTPAPDPQGPKAYVPPFNVPGDMGRGDVGGGLGLEDLRGRSAAVPQINITVELDGQTVGGAIRDGQINDSLSGSFSQTNRFGAKGAIAL